MSASQVVNPGGPCKRPPVVVRRHGHGGKKVIKRRKGICPVQS